MVIKHIFLGFILLLTTTPAFAQISEDRAYEIAYAIYDSLEPMISAKGFGEPSVVINPDGEDHARMNTIRAHPFQGKLEFYELIIEGGALSVKGGELTFAQILCHEFGHLLGRRMNGSESKWDGGHYDNDLLAPEGEADYNSLKFLTKVIAQKPKLLDLSCDNKQLDIARSYLKRKIGIDSQKKLDHFATLIVAAWQGLADEPISPFTPDKTIVPETIRDYPSNQGRLDSAIAGLLGLPRPKCWCAFE